MLRCGDCGRCRLCELARTRADYRGHWGQGTAPDPTPAACVHRGDDLKAGEAARLGLNPLKLWCECGRGLARNDRGVPGVACRGCGGCGPGCPGYEAEDGE